MFREILKNQNGLSLNELLITLIIMGIVLSIAIPGFSEWLPKHRVNAMAREVYFDLMLARTTAVTHNNNVIVSFSTSGNHSYTIHDDTDEDGVQDAGETVKTISLKDNIQFGFNSGVSDVDGNALGSGIVMGADDLITFDSRGMAGESGSVYLIPKQDIGDKSARMRAVSVLQATGQVELFKYDQGASPGPWS